MFVELAGRIKHHGEALDAVLDRGRYQGLIESTNIKIRLLTRIAFGFRSPVALIAGKSEVRKNLPSLITNTSWRVSWFDESEPAVGPPPGERWINHDLLHRNSAILCLAVAVASVVEDTALIGDTDVADVRPGQLQPAIPPAPRSTPGAGGFLTRQNAGGGVHFHRWSSEGAGQMVPLPHEKRHTVPRNDLPTNARARGSGRYRATTGVEPSL